MTIDVDSSKEIHKLSQDSLFIWREVLKITLSFLEIHEYNRLTGAQIPFKKFEDKGLHRDDVIAIFNQISGCTIMYQDLRRHDLINHPLTNYEVYPRELDGLPSKKDLEDYLFLRIKDIEELIKINGFVEKKLTKRDETIQLKIYISDDDGIYRTEGDNRLEYKISGKRLQLILALKDGKKTGPDLLKLYKNLQGVSQAVANINGISREKLALDEDIIISVATNGYKLNNKYIFEYL